MIYILIGLLFGMNISQWLYFKYKFKSNPTVVQTTPTEPARSMFSVLYGNK